AAGRDRKITKLPGIAGGWTQSRDIPAPPAESFRTWWAKDHQRPEIEGARKPSQDKGDQA
ncbi:MAG: L-lactate dehydrogenase complex protein LldF, partial [Actinomycetota bacterium]|nr:L-lactate dehydrogenase complex protein LldF [Actinomycetota bacterium]